MLLYILRAIKTRARIAFALFSVFLLVTPLSATAQAVIWDDDGGVISVRSGTHPNAGKSNDPVYDTAAVVDAISRAKWGGTIYFPAGNYQINGPITINNSKPLSVIGVGPASQVRQMTSGQPLFVFQGITGGGISVRDIYLGANFNTAGTSLIKFQGTHRSSISNVMLIGGYYGIYLNGSLGNSIEKIRSGTAAGGFVGVPWPGPTNNTWIYADRDTSTNVSSNANSIISPMLEGGTNGISIIDTNGEGNIQVIGGSIEGNSGVGLKLQGTGQPTSVFGTHFETNAGGDIQINSSSRVRIESILATTTVSITGGSYNNSIVDSMVNSINIASTARRTRVEGVTYALTAGGAITNSATDTIFTATSVVNTLDTFGTVGIGGVNPDSSATSSTPNVRLDVRGTVKAKAYLTGDIHFFKDDKRVQRMFEDEKGLYLENYESGKISRIYTEDDVAPLEKAVRQLQKQVGDLRKRK